MQFPRSLSRIAFSLCLMIVGCNNQKSSEIQEIPVNLGVIEATEVIRTSLPLANPRGEPFKVESIKASCACLKVDDISGQTVLPGQKIDVNVELRAGGSKGRYAQAVAINTNNRTKQWVSFQVNGWIVPPEKVIVEPSTFLFRADPQREAVSSIVFAYGRKADLQDCKFTSENPSLRFRFVGELEEVKDYRGIFRRKLQVDLQSGDPSGPSGGIVRINGLPAGSFSIDIHPSEEIPVVGKLFFGRIENGGVGVAQLKDPDLVIDSIRIECPLEIFKIRSERGDSTTALYLSNINNGAAKGLVNGVATASVKKAGLSSVEIAIPFSCYLE